MDDFACGRAGTGLTAYFWSSDYTTPPPQPLFIEYNLFSAAPVWFFLLADSSSSFHAFPSNQLVNVALKWIDTFVVEPLWFDEDFYGIPLVTASGVPQ